MPNYLIMAGNSAGTNITASRYCQPIGVLYNHPTEAIMQVLARDSYTLSNLYVYVPSNTRDATTVIKSRKQTPPGAAADGNQSVSILATATGGFEDTLNTDSLVDSDLFCGLVEITSGAGTIKLSIFSYILVTVSNTTPILLLNSSWGQAKVLTRWYPIIGRAVEGTATEANTYYTFRSASTLSNLRCYVSSNGVTATSTLRTRINEGNGSQAISIGSTLTGAFEDTTHSDSISVGQNVNYQLATGATGTSIIIDAIQVKSTSDGRQTGIASPAATTLAFDLTRYATIEGNSQAFNATEANVQATARTAFTAANMYVNISTNSLNGATSFNLRKDTGNSTLMVSVGATATGQFEDLAHTDSYVAASLINWMVDTTASSSGTIVINCIGFELQQPLVAPVVGSKTANMAAKMIAAGFI